MRVPNTVDGAAFFRFAREELSAWEAIVGQRIAHEEFGTGTVIKAQVRTCLKESVFTIRWDKAVTSVRGIVSNEIRYIALVFDGSAITELTLPPDLIDRMQHWERVQQEKKRLAGEEEKHRHKVEAAVEALQDERRRQREREAAARDDFRRLKEKYGASWFIERSPLSLLYAILLKLEDDTRLSNDDEEWLREERLLAVLAKHYEREGLLAAAGSCWRKARIPRPERALAITEGIEDDHMVLTMRGGAFRDLRDLDRAEACGRKAIGLKPDDFHPYNLLGAVFYQRGDPKKGEAFFVKARELGSNERSVDASIRSAIELSDENVKERVARYLVDKDPERYAWANTYIR